MSSFTQASPPPAARDAGAAFASIAAATDLQSKNWETAQIVQEERSSASVASQAAVRDAMNEQSQSTKYAGIGDIGSGVFSASGPVSDAVTTHIVAPSLADTKTVQARLTTATGHETAVNQIMNMSADARGRVIAGNGPVAAAPTEAQALQVVRNTDLSQPYNSDTHDSALAFAHDRSPDAFDAHVKRVSTEKKAAQKASDALEASYQRFGTQLSTLLQTGGTLMKGGEQINSANAQSNQADLEALKIALSTTTDSMKSVIDQVVQGAQAVDQQKEGIVQTLMRAQSEANHV